ncbi:hypothetical protein KKH27_05950 [bacterium]|nr:hypothetical protein [bacterium]MBU1984755.1 hypothetical protein [bacterium]
MDESLRSFSGAFIEAIKAPEIHPDILKTMTNTASTLRSARFHLNQWLLNAAMIHGVPGLQSDKAERSPGNQLLMALIITYFTSSIF